MSPPPKRPATSPSASDPTEEIVVEIDPTDFDEEHTPIGLKGQALVEFRAHQAVATARQAKKMVSDAIAKDDKRFTNLSDKVDQQRESTDLRFVEQNVLLTKLAVESAGNTSSVARMAVAVEKLTEVQTAQTVSMIQVETTKQTAKIEDEADAKKTRRGVWGRIIGGIFGGGALMEILHRFF